VRGEEWKEVWKTGTTENQSGSQGGWRRVKDDKIQLHCSICINWI